jgi:radical SAM superfamily enzyme YgiQ (UPF0313 family)
MVECRTLAMRVLLVNTNRSRDLLPPPPVGLAYLASAAADAGHEVEILDLMRSKDPAVALRRALRQQPRDVVGLSVRNLDNLIRQRVRPQLLPVNQLIELVRAESRAPIVLGGSAVSIAGAATLRRLAADYAIVGEGERSFPLLLQALAGQRPFDQVPGLLRRSGGDVLATPPEREPSFGRSGLERWVDWRDYAKLGSTWPIQGKRGCPLPCNYCLYGAIEGARHRLRPPVEIVDEMAAVQAAARPRAFEFVDSTFNVPTDHAFAVCEEIVRRDLRTALTAQGVNPLGATPALMTAMRRAGFNSFMVSAESASDRMLARLGKGYTSAHVHRTRDATRASGMVSLWFFMLGGPGETEASVEETVSFAERQLDWPGCLSIFFTGVRVLPGTEVEKIARAEGQVARDDDLVAPRFYLSPEIDERRVQERIRRALAVRPNLVHAAEEDASIQRLMNAVLPRIGIAPPYWRFLPLALRSFPLRQLRRLRADFGDSANPADRPEQSPAA